MSIESEDELRALRVASDFNPMDVVIYVPRHVDRKWWDSAKRLYFGEDRGIVTLTSDNYVWVRFTTGSSSAMCEPTQLVIDRGQDRSPAGNR